MTGLPLNWRGMASEAGPLTGDKGFQAGWRKRVRPS